MQGFKPKTHKPQHLAGGGIVDSIKGMLGFKPEDPERAKMLAEYRANQEREKQAKQAQAKPAEKAISSYSGDSALQRRMKEVDSYKDGGLIRGPGTGTSDSIPRGFKPGTFIMPADSTKAIGPEVLENIAKVPTKVSNGEFAHTPQEVHAVGINALRQMKDATHNSKDDGVYFANGGQVRDPNRPDIPVVGTRGPVMGGGGGGLSREAVAQAQRPQAPQPSKYGVGALPANPVTNPGAIIADRERKAQGFAAGGVVQRLFTGDKVLSNDEKRAVITAQSTFPNSHPDAGANIYGGVGRGPSGPSVLDTDQQAKADRASLSKLAGGISDANQNAGRAILDVATIVPRGLAGAYDSAVVRPMRAAGINAGYLSPKLVPDGVDTASMTPFTDQKRIQDNAISGGGRGFVNPSMPKAAPMNDVSEPNPTDMRLASGTQSTPGLSTESPMAPTGVTRTGNSYTGPANITGDISVNGQAPRGSVTSLPAGATPFVGSPAISATGFSPSTQGISAQNMGAADALAARGQAESMGRLIASGQIQAPGAGPSFIMQSNTGFRRDPRLVAPEDAARRTLRYAQGDDPASRERKAKFQTAQLEQQGIAQRNQATNDIAQKELALKTEAQGFTTRAAQQMEKMRNVLLDPKATPEQKAQAQAQLSALSGGQNAKDRYMTVGGGTRVVDGQTVKDPVSVFDTQTKTWIDQPGKGAAASPQAPLANPSTRPVGTISTVNGKTATWDGKQWVPRA